MRLKGIDRFDTGQCICIVATLRLTGLYPCNRFLAGGDRGVELHRSQRSEQCADLPP